MTDGDLITLLNDWNTRNVRTLNGNLNKGIITGGKFEPSLMKHVPEPLIKVVPVPKYISTKGKEEEEPKYPTGLTTRIKQTRQDTFHPCQRQINHQKN